MGQPISVELDPAASVPVMAGKVFKRTFPGVFVEASGVMMRSYSGHLVQVEGQAQVSVRLDDREATLPLFLTKGSSPTLLGRNWIQALGVQLPEYQEAVRVVEDAPNLLNKFKALFQSGVGTFTGSAASIHVSEGARPRFFKPRPLPLALKDRAGSPRSCNSCNETTSRCPSSLQNLWSALSGGRKVTKLDFRDAYQQLVLEESARKQA
ncbi:uncharacterized protein LOC144175558 [Haemaphysalis longicornis]